jgi:hypothetical protein
MHHPRKMDLLFCIIPDKVILYYSIYSSRKIVGKLLVICSKNCFKNCFIHIGVVVAQLSSMDWLHAVSGFESHEIIEALVKYMFIDT